MSDAGYQFTDTVVFGNNKNIIIVLCRLIQVPKPWYRSYLSAKAVMQQDLFRTNPTMIALLDIWHKTFGYV